MATIGARGAVRGGVQVMADATTNAPSAANAKNASWGSWVNFSRPSTWAWLYFGVAMAFLAFMYFGHGGTRGAVF